MKRLLFLFLAFSIQFPFYGQDQKTIDSLLYIIEQSNSLTDKVDTYISIALEYSGLDSINSNLYLRKGQKLADSLRYEKGMMDSWYVMGRNAMLKGDYFNAEIHLRRMVEWAQQRNYKKGLADGYFGIAWLSYYHGDYKQSIEDHLRSLEVRKTLGNKKDIASSMRGLGITYKLRGEFEQALFYLSQSLTLEQEINNLGGMAETLNHIGVINSLRGYYGFAMDSYFKALDIQEKVGDKSGLAYTFQNMGVIHDIQKEYDKALEYYDRSLTLREEIGERRGVAQIINNMGVVYHEQQNYDKALEYYQRALQIKISLEDKRGVADGHLNIGKLYADQGMNNEAISNKLKSLRISEETNSDWGKVNSLISLGESYYDTKNNAKAKQYLIEGIQLAKESSLIENVREGAGLLAKVEKDLGHYKEAYEAQVLFQQMSDSLSNEENTKRIALLEAEHKFQQEKDSIQFINERETLLLDQKIQDQRNTQFATFITLIVVVIILVILYRYYRLKNLSNNRLSVLNEEIKERNELLKALNEEKNNLIGIVAHDLQNPLAGIITASDLLEDNELSDDYQKLKEIIQVNSLRMHKMVAEILDVEAIEKSADEMDLQPHDLSKTMTEVVNSFENIAADKNIEIKSEIKEAVTALVDEKYVIQIIENLISNAIKFSSKDKTIEVKLLSSNDKAVIEVKDEGPGLTEDDKTKLFQKFQRLSAKPTGNESSTGLGLSIVKKFVEKMEGSIWCESESGKGASFFVSLNIHKP